MTGLKPWYQVATPREDLRTGQPLDASEFAIHLDQVKDGRAPRDYCDPQRFFARTYLTTAFTKLSVELMRRLSGQRVGTSPGVNLTTQFGGGKSHFLTLLYHLFQAGDKAKGWMGVQELLAEARLPTVPRARVATFIGNRFDFVRGVGAPGEPKRRTPWGDIAWQLGGGALFSLVEQHDQDGVVPGGEIVQKLLEGEPKVILMDEVLNFIRRARDAGPPYDKLGSQFYSFLDVLSREISGCGNAVLVVSLPMSEYEMTQQDVAEFERLDKLLARLAKAVLLSEQMEIAEIIRRRLFEDVGDTKEIRHTAKEYADWIVGHREQLPGWFPADQALAMFEAAYPFHPTLLSVFERKWQSLPKFQRTRGVLRLLALWVSMTYPRAFTAAHKDALLTLGSAPLDNSVFRAAAFEQLGEPRLEAAVLSDIAGQEAHAVRMDAEAHKTIGRMRLHQKVATAVFFESCGGQVRNEATLPEIRLAAGEPGLDIGNIETVLDDLVRRCYYLDVKGTAYWVSHRPTLNKILANRRAVLDTEEGKEAVRERVRQTIREAFKSGAALERRYFPEASSDLPDTPALTLVVLAPEHSWEAASRDATRQLVRTMIQDCGGRGRTYKSGLLFAVAESGAALADEARTLLAVESLEDPAEQQRLRLEPSQLIELAEKKKLTMRNLKDGVWRAYRHLLLLAQDGDLQEIDLGLIHPSQADSLTGLIIARLRQEGLLEDRISPDFLVRNWPPALSEWSTKGVRDTFFASPKFPRLLDASVLRDTVAEGVRNGKFGYAIKSYGGYQTSINDPAFSPATVEFSDEVVLLPRDAALAVIEEAQSKEEEVEKRPAEAGERSVVGYETMQKPPVGAGVPIQQKLPGFNWEGELPPQKWTTFYMKVLTKFATDPSLRIRLRFEVTPPDGITAQQVEETKMALRELGLSDADV